MSRLPYFVCGLALIAMSVILIAEAFRNGGAHLALVLVIPVIYGNSVFLAAGSLLLVLGIFMALAGLAMGEEVQPRAVTTDRALKGTAAPSRSNTTYGGFLFIGPVPVVFGNKEKMLPYMMAMVVVTVLAVVLLLILL